MPSDQEYRIMAGRAKCEYHGCNREAPLSAMEGWIVADDDRIICPKHCLLPLDTPAATGRDVPPPRFWFEQ